jgi:D-alanine-D-alanine ligase
MSKTALNDKVVQNKTQQRKKTAGSHIETLGPVANLEEHVRPDWWRFIFSSLYLKTDGDVIDDQAITSKELDLFSDILKISPDQRILDLCCGQGRHALELARRGFCGVSGIDRSHYLVQRAKARARKEGLKVRFREGDARKLPYSTDTFDAVTILGNSFGYFETVRDDLRVLKEVFRILRPSGKLLIDVTDGDYLRRHFEPRSWEWVDKKLFVCRERSLSMDAQRLISREVITHVDKGVIADQFYAERLYTRETLLELLRAAGFSDPTVHGELSPNSQRNQDLGMMARRLIVSAAARKQWAPIKPRPNQKVSSVVVILGDPTKRDPIKPASVFDDDDFYTIDELKAALRSLNGYMFTFLSDHDTLISDMMRLKSKTDFVFNLCDEGYNNDPRHELHIPSLLEMLGVPYTGGGPQCVAFCYDKSLVRGIAKEMEIPVPMAFFVHPEDTAFELPFGFPVIVKPNFGDSSFGITQRSVAYDHEALLNSISDIRENFGYDKPIIVEEFLTGSDLSVGIIGNPPTSYSVLPITEEDYSALPEGLPRICGYEAKWAPDSPYWNIKSVAANLPDEVEKSIVKWCVDLFERLECRDYARFDWRLDAAGNPRLLEVNPNPGWCWDGHLAKMAGIGGKSYAEMLEMILRATQERLISPDEPGASDPAAELQESAAAAARC